MKLLRLPAVLVFVLLLSPSGAPAQALQEQAEAPRSLVELRPVFPAADSLRGAPELEIAHSLGARKRSRWLIPGIGAATGAVAFSAYTYAGCVRVGACGPQIFLYTVIMGGSFGGVVGLTVEELIRLNERRSEPRYE